MESYRRATEEEIAQARRTVYQRLRKPENLTITSYEFNRRVMRELDKSRLML